MQFEDRVRLARTGHYDSASTAKRMLAARMVTGLSQVKLAAAVGLNPTTIVAIEKGRQLPNWNLMAWLFEQHRIDMTFIVYGAFQQLPLVVAEKLFACLDAERDKYLPETGEPRQESPE